MSQGTIREALTEDFEDGDVLDRFATARDHERRAEQLRSDALAMTRERLQEALPFRADIDLTYDEQAAELRATVRLAEARDALADAFDHAAVEFAAPMEVTLADKDETEATSAESTTGEPRDSDVSDTSPEESPARPDETGDQAREPPMSDGGRAAALESRADSGSGAGPGPGSGSPPPLSSIVAEMEPEYEDGAPVEHIKHEARAAGHDPESLDQKLDALRERGAIYESTMGCLRAR